MKKATKKKKFSQKEKFTVTALLLVIGFSWTVIGVKAATTWEPSISSDILLVTEPADVTGTTADIEALGNPGIPSCCGTAANKTYSATSTSFGVDTFCKPPAIRTNFPKNVLFPASGGTARWRCQCNNTQNIMGEEIVGSNTTIYSDCSAKREGPGKCGPNNAKTVFFDEFVPPFDSWNNERIQKLVTPCAEGIPEGYNRISQSENSLGGCVNMLFRCGSVTCTISVCTSNQKGKSLRPGFRFCGNGILDSDLGEECDKCYRSDSSCPKDFNSPYTGSHPELFNNNNNPFYSHMFGHRCADQGLCGAAKCTDKCKVDYSGCYPCPPTKGGSGEIIK